MEQQIEISEDEFIKLESNIKTLSFKDAYGQEFMIIDGILLRKKVKSNASSG